MAGGGRSLMADAARWGDLLFLSGRAAVDPETFQLRAGDFEAQARIVLDDIASVLERSGSGLEHVLRVECYLADGGDFAAWNRIFAERFPSSPPARTTLVSAFVIDGMLVEVQVTAGVPS
ncbi:MAG: RidA family protein [Solirubrobacteraceae bacterium]|jgi:2-iminobutanoate/2-iminopropanoate deaminase